MSESLTAAARVAIARHPQRPNITDYIQALFTDFFEQKGDRLCGGDAIAISISISPANVYSCIVSFLHARKVF